MSLDQWIANSISFGTFVVIFVGGIVALLQYRKIITNIDENARARQATLDTVGQTLQRETQRMINLGKHQRNLISLFMAITIAMLVWMYYRPTGVKRK